MKKVVIIPDSFKGTMSSIEVSGIMKEAVLNLEPECNAIAIPVADGGEGSVDAFLSFLGGEKIYKYVTGPYEDELVEGYYGMLPDGVAVIEMAAAAALPMVGDRKNPARTTTFGVGELIKDALDRNAKKIILALGGSCTNDAATGLASFLGAEFHDENGRRFIPTGGTLERIRSMDLSRMDERLETVPIITMCDIDNPFYGKEGAAFVFGPQKGADDDMVELLDRNLRYFADLLKTETGIDVQEIPGSGAAGGMGGGMAAMFHSTLKMGIDTVLDTVGFDDLVKDADFVFTGEGKLDTQSLRGKVVLGVARRAKALGVKTIAFVGDIGDGIDKVYDEGVGGVFSINRVAVGYQDARVRAKKDLALTVDNVVRFVRTLE